jgi:hypothetical protein
MNLTNQFFKKILIFFWATWWLIALWTDVTSGLTHLTVLNVSWAPDLNYPALVESLKMYSVPSWMPVFLFLSIILWALISTCAFLWASVGILQNNQIWRSRAQVAFIISLTFWLTLFLADQLVMKFDFEQNHMVQGGFQLLTYLAFYILPE